MEDSAEYQEISCSCGGINDHCARCFGSGSIRVRKEKRNINTDYELRDRNIEFGRLLQTNQDLRNHLDAMTLAKNRVEIERDSLSRSRNRLVGWIVSLSILLILCLFAQLQK
jgi:hypothetical protein